MDMIQMEYELDPLAIERSDNTDTEEQKPLSEEGNILDLHVTGVKTECMDHSYDVKTEMTFFESLVPMDFHVVKSEVEESALHEEENELHLDMTEIKMECIDKSYDLKSEITFDEIPVPIGFPIMKSEVQEARELNKVEEEVRLEVTAEEDEVFTEG
ncbi:uncharacterized protein [Periplaneta americana]